MTVETFSVEAALQHLRAVDPPLAAIIDRVGAYNLTIRRTEPYATLLRTILFQQLAGAAASAIQRRFLALYGEDGEPPAPEQLLSTSDEDLRGAGISRQKIGYMRDLASKVASGELPLDRVEEMDDDDLIDHLVQVKGIGRWTAQMFLMFRLGRPDVLPVGDYGIRKGFGIAFRQREMPLPAEVEKGAERWRPYRTVASWYLWRATD